MKKYFVALFATVITAAFLFSGMVSHAQAAPVVQWRVVKIYPVVNKNHPSMKDKNHLNLHVSIQYKNVSRDQIITAIFDKALLVEGSAKFYSEYRPSQFHPKDTYGYAYKYRLTSVKVNKMELYPGQSIQLGYEMPLSAFIKIKGVEASLIEFNKIHYKKFIARVTGHTFKFSRRPI